MFQILQLRFRYDRSVGGAAALLCSAVGFLWLAMKGLRSKSGVNRSGQICPCGRFGGILVVALMIASVAESAFGGQPTAVGLVWLLAGAVLGFGGNCEPPMERYRAELHASERSVIARTAAL